MKRVYSLSASLHRYEELCNPGYNFNSGQFTMGTGHFSQLVWKDTRDLGVGLAVAVRDGIRCAYIVGRYKPPGNYQGQFQRQVLRGNYDKGICDTISAKRAALPRYFKKNDKNRRKYGTWVL